MTYDLAQQSFAAASEANPECGMAYLGRCDDLHPSALARRQPRDRISELVSQVPASSEPAKEIEQKFRILYSPRQAELDFASYSSQRGTGAKHRRLVS